MIENLETVRELLNTMYSNSHCVTERQKKAADDALDALEKAMREPVAVIQKANTGSGFPEGGFTRIIWFNSIEELPKGGLYLAAPNQTESTLCVGESRFESWYNDDLLPHGKSVKQLMREAYEAGMNDSSVKQSDAVPVLFISKGQFDAMKPDPDDESGNYLPIRRAANGNFQFPLYAAAPKQAECDECPKTHLESDTISQLQQKIDQLEWENKGIAEWRDIAIKYMDAYHVLISKSNNPTQLSNIEAAYHEMTDDRNQWRSAFKMIQQYHKSDVWYWQGDGEDHVESMVNDLPVVIRAYELRELIRKNNG